VDLRLVAVRHRGKGYAGCPGYHRHRCVVRPPRSVYLASCRRGSPDARYGGAVTETRALDEMISEALAVIDKGLGELGHRELVSSNEVADLLLDVRTLLAQPSSSGDRDDVAVVGGQASTRGSALALDRRVRRPEKQGSRRGMCSLRPSSTESGSLPTS